ncbi:discoidin domain-containing protein [Streptomyces sp. NBC_01381]|uniref:galactose-binding domain-containing protein n=1 Tax=Streptomyces sp. NBC_01381 TaxID=2903845 RepID=UPI0022577AE5|nr:discoidin domain-containing protein [Streptomyces sp. NBC_01381]MCX4667389.1 discoidin domain-containing protein [Streptomyces sp. NBC_01381]
MTNLSRRTLIAATAVAGAAVALPSPTAHAVGAGAPPAGATSRGNARPAVIPALQEWAGGDGAHRLTPESRVVVPAQDAGQLLVLAQQLTRDIADITGLKLAAPRAVRRSRAADGEILLRLDAAARHAKGGELYAREGYELAVRADAVTLTAPAYSGVYYGTRSLLQVLLHDEQRSRVPVGTAQDWPNYRLRGFMLDVGRRFFTPGFVRDYLRVMGWFKLNDLQLHLNDNEIKAPGGDWSKAYDAFRLRSDAAEWEGLAAPDGSYSRADWDSFEDTAALHAVQLTPEIDAPAHSRSFVRFRPSLGLDGGNSDHLDLAKPETTAFMKAVFEEFVPWFRSPEVHYGADEYTGPEAQYRAYFNDMAEHLRSLGKHPRAWGSLTEMAGSADGYDRDVTIHSWNNGWYGPQAAKADGYEIVNTNDGLLYVVPFADYYHGHGLDGRYLYDSWEPHVFPGSESLDPGDPQLRGAMSAVWNDLVHATYTQQDVHGLIEKTYGTLAQKMWSGGEQGLAYGEFTALLRRGARGPGLSTVTPTLADPDELAFGAAATASSGAHASYVSDGSHVTCWTSAAEAGGPWVRVDLGAVRHVGRVRLDWGREHGRSYDVEVSDDGSAWRRVASRRGLERAGWDELEFGGVEARYVRVRGRENGRVRWVLWSVQVFDVPDLARGREATASSAETASLGAENAVDGDAGTRWASKYTDGEWIAVDLGEERSVRRVLLDWEAAAGRDYDVQVSADGGPSGWRTVAERRGREEAGVDVVDLPSVAARFVRMQGVKRQTEYGYSLYRFEVRG